MIWKRKIAACEPSCQNCRPPSFRNLSLLSHLLPCHLPNAPSSLEKKVLISHRVPHKPLSTKRSRPSGYVTASVWTVEMHCDSRVTILSPTPCEHKTRHTLSLLGLVVAQVITSRFRSITVFCLPSLRILQCLSYGPQTKSHIVTVTLLHKCHLHVLR